MTQRRTKLGDLITTTFQQNPNGSWTENIVMEWGGPSPLELERKESETILPFRKQVDKR